ncbi:MAG: TVP38/TMEM64 family protein [Hyphomonadaceae bacterium]|nr:TVP38/TMEM64 family protein [Hyphomonadaceae bacterium]
MSNEQAPAEHEPRKRQPIWIRLWPIYLIAAGILIAWQAGVFQYLSLETLRANYAVWAGFVAENLVLSFVIFVAIYAAATTFMLPGALWITIAGGLLFGLASGALATIAGATLGASILFFAARTSIGTTLHQRAGPFLKKMERGFREDELSYMFFMRLFPAMPFPVANIAPALLGAKYRNFLLTTAVGIIPGVVAYTWIGFSLRSSLDPEETQSLLGVVGNFLPAFAALGIVALMPVAYKKFFGRKKPDSLEGTTQ